MSTVVTAALACLVVSTAVVSCTDSATTAEEPSAEQMLDNANGTMKALKSVTIDGDTTMTAGGGYSSHLTTDLKGRCASKTTWVTGAGLEQVRIGGTDYVRPNRAYLKQWSGRYMTGVKGQSRWIKAPSSRAHAGDGLAECTREFTSFGVAKKGEPTKVNGTPAIPLVVTDEADKGGLVHLLCRHRQQAVHPQGRLQKP